mmetsp:Transcript_22525/g.45233  ORF Transcript_22525/g.45233 Transcript_22525/m.45233 type:complete len:311 (+) Transcript_22525:940-1872(+)
MSPAVAALFAALLAAVAFFGRHPHAYPSLSASLARKGSLSAAGISRRCLRGPAGGPLRDTRQSLRMKGKLLIPGEDGLDDEGTFTPFMKPLTKVEREKYGKPKIMLRNLRFGAGPWMERAEMVDILLRSGVTPESIIEDGGIGGMEQGNWRVALEVLRTLEELGCPDEVLEYFRSDDDMADVVFGLRTTPKEIRVRAAEYAYSREFDRRDTEAMSKFITDYERMPEAMKEHFGFTPEDCMALRFYIQASESTDDGCYNQYVQRARNSGASEAAMKKFDELDMMTQEERRKIIYQFKHDTEEYDRALTTSI